MEQLDGLVDVVNVLRRRMRLVLGVALIGAVLAAFVALLLPRTYQAQAVIQIELPKISEQSSPPTTSVGAQAKYRLTLIEQQLMARDSLLGIIDELNLFAGHGLSDAEKVTAIRQTSVIEQIVEQSDAWRPDVVPSGLRIIVEMGDAKQAADTANLFLSRILSQAEARRAEQAIAALSFFEGEEARVGAKMMALEAEIAAFKVENAAILPDGLPTLRLQLTGLKETELGIERDLIALRANASRVRGDVLSNQIGELQVQSNLVTDRIAEIEALLLVAPQVEHALNLMAREQQKLQGQFTIITQRGAEAEMGQMLQTSEQTERFEVLERAIVPDYPVAPSRKKIVAAGAVVFFLIGAALALVQNALKPAIRTAAHLERALGVAPIVSIPVIEEAGADRKNVGMLFAVAALIIGVIAAIASALWTPLRSLFGGEQAAVPGSQG